jgi:hypothetical protein
MKKTQLNDNEPRGSSLFFVTNEKKTTKLLIASDN